MRQRLAIALFVAAGLLGCAGPPRPAAPVQVKILAINDFHGNLRPPQGGIRIRDPQDAGTTSSSPPAT
jgi:5'-nucleotidase